MAEPDTTELAIDGVGLYYLPERDREVAVPVRILAARRTGVLRVDLLVTPIGGFGEFWIQQSSLVEFEDMEDIQDAESND